MQVSFTSISNPCHIGLRSFIDENEEFNSFSVIVKDDRFGNDYSDYKKALQRSNQECNYLSDINHNLVNLMVNKKLMKIH